MGLCIPAVWKQLITLQVALLARGSAREFLKTVGVKFLTALWKRVEKSAWFGPHTGNEAPLSAALYSSMQSYLFFLLPGSPGLVAPCTDLSVNSLF